MTDSFEKRCETQFVKHGEDDELGLAIGWAMVSSQEGDEYFDLQGDHAPDEAIMKAALDFAENSRVAGDMHKDEVGTVPFIFPLTEQVAKALGIESPQYGLLIAMHPSEEVYEKFKSGDYTGFSIGGVRVEDEEVEDAA